jgi:hypothetical protein
MPARGLALALGSREDPSLSYMKGVARSAIPLERSAEGRDEFIAGTRAPLVRRPTARTP